jgi:hypothetical protein
MKPLNKHQFRLLLVLMVVTTLLSGTVMFFGESLLPERLREYEQAQAAADLTTKDWVLLGFIIPIAIASVVAVVGLYRFSPWARPLAVILWIMPLIWAPFSGPTVEPGLATVLYECSCVFFGMVMALIYFSPAAHWFQTTTGTVPQAG